MNQDNKNTHQSLFEIMQAVTLHCILKITNNKTKYFLAQGVTYPVNNIYHHDRIAAKMQENLDNSTWLSPAEAR